MITENRSHTNELRGGPSRSGGNLGRRGADLVLMRNRQVSAYQKWPELLAGALSGLGGVAVAQGRMARAARLFGAASHVAEPSPPMFFRVDRERDAVVARTELGEAVFDARFSEGRALTTEQAIDLALQDEARKSHIDSAQR